MIYKVKSTATAAPVTIEVERLTVKELKEQLPDVVWENSKISFLTKINIEAMQAGTAGIRPSVVETSEGSFVFPLEDTNINISPVHMKQGIIPLTTEELAALLNARRRQWVESVASPTKVAPIITPSTVHIPTLSEDTPKEAPFEWIDVSNVLAKESYISPDNDVTPNVEEEDEWNW